MSFRIGTLLIALLLVGALAKPFDLLAAEIGKEVEDENFYMCPTVRIAIEYAHILNTSDAGENSRLTDDEYYKTRDGLRLLALDNFCVQIVEPSHYVAVRLTYTGMELTLNRNGKRRNVVRYVANDKEGNPGEIYMVTFHEFPDEIPKYTFEDYDRIRKISDEEIEIHKRALE